MCKKMKRIVTWAIVVCLGIIGFSLAGAKNAKASDEVKVKEYNQISPYRSEGAYTVPTFVDEEEGYVFSGWFTDQGCSTPLGEDVKEGKAWARFVPDAVMDVKVQITANLIDSDAENNDSAGIRFVTTVDSLQYREIGFKLAIADQDQGTKSSSKVYDRMYAIGEKDGEVLEYTPEDFCPLSKYFKSWAYTNVPQSAYGTEITATSFWVTLDGTTVEGSKKTATIQEGIDSYFEKKVDTSWYDANPNAEEFTIDTPQELYGFADLVTNQKVDFANKTVKLGADITLNVGNAEEWAETAPKNAWTPVNGLAGTFNGQGHTISGLYVKSNATYTGLFGTINKGAKVGNLKIVNSYIEGNKTGASGNRAGVGSVAGRNTGTIDAVYSEAIVKNSALMTGGIAGMASQTGENTISNCWFNGQICANGSSGGILGGNYGASATIEHCLNTGTVTINTGGNDVGGLYGYAQSSAILILKDSLNAGYLISKGEAGEHIGTVLGSLDNKATLNVGNVYGITEFSKDVFGDTAGTVTQESSTDYKAIALNKITGIAANKNTSLDFKDYWICRNGEVPVLKVLDEGDLDVSWYYGSEEDDEFTISTPQELYGMCALGVDFGGKTINLGADITLNTGDAKDWMNNAPDDIGIWTVRTLAGTFNGNGHTISGLYVNSKNTYTGLFGTINAGAKVMNLKIVNSYIEGNCTTATNDRAGVGSIAGRNTGTIDTVYSEAIVKNNVKMTGGIVGMVTQDGENLIRNCWFAGEIYANEGSGGILGCTYGQAATIEHCLNTGTLNIASGTQVGGLCGYVQGKAVLTLKDSLNAGSLIKGTDVSQIGTIIGAFGDTGSPTLNVNSAYGITETGFSETAFGHNTAGTIKEDGEYKVVTPDQIMGDAAKENTQLDFVGSWTCRDGEVPIPSVFVKEE